MFDLLKFFRRPAPRPAFQIEEYYTPSRFRGAEPARLTALEQMYAYYGAR